MPRKAVHRSTSRRLVRGAVMTEYTVLVAFVGLATMAAFVGFGVVLARSFESRREQVVYPFP